MPQSLVVLIHGFVFSPQISDHVFELTANDFKEDLIIQVIIAGLHFGQKLKDMFQISQVDSIKMNNLDHGGLRVANSFIILIQDIGNLRSAIFDEKLGGFSHCLVIEWPIWIRFSKTRKGILKKL